MYTRKHKATRKTTPLRKTLSIERKMLVELNKEKPKLLILREMV